MPYVNLKCGRIYRQHFKVFSLNPFLQRAYKEGIIIHSRDQYPIITVLYTSKLYLKELCMYFTCNLKERRDERYCQVYGI
jgi:hypothetical protein